MLSDYNNREWSDFNTYAVSAGQGTIVGAGTAVTATYGAGALVVAGTAGTLTATTQLVGDKLLGRTTNRKDLAVNTAISIGSAGTLSKLPNVRGRLPNIGTSAFYTGAHTQRQATEEFVTGSLQSLGQSTRGYVSSRNSSKNSTINQLKSIVSQLKSIVKILEGLKKN